MAAKINRRTIVLLWAGWVVAILLFQNMVPARFDIGRPDYALNWTPSQTLADSQEGRIYLQEPFLNSHAAWDSEYYLAIAIGGYDNPNIDRVGESFVSGGGGFWPFVVPATSAAQPGVSKSYAFFPFYPLMIRLVSAPLSLLGLNSIATGALAGVVVSLLGTLAGMVALFELGRDELGADGGLRAVFYLLVFPSGFFLAQVYTEGLFVGLAFSSLLLLRRGHRNWAALLAVLATFTRAVGVSLAVPLLISFIQDGDWLALDIEWRQIYYRGVNWRALGRVLVALSPVIAFFVWRYSYYGLAFNYVEQVFFGRNPLSLAQTFVSWTQAFKTLSGPNPQAVAYYAVEFGAVVLGFAACIAGFKRHPDLAWFGFLVVFLSFTSGPAQGMHRYILAAPPVFLFLSRLGKNSAFDRGWTIFSVLIMSIFAIMYTFDMWAG